MTLGYTQQYTLFDLGHNLTGAAKLLEELMTQGKHALNTTKGYRHSCKVFERWCNATGHVAFPTDPQTVKLFIAWAVSERAYKVANIAHILSAIKDQHTRNAKPTPVTEEVFAVLWAAKRMLREQPKRKLPITVQDLQRMRKRLGNSPRDVRDLAILLLGFASGWRGGELSSLNLSSLEFQEEGVIVCIGKTKGDQIGEGREIAIPFAKRRPTLCAVQALKAWLKVRGKADGALFFTMPACGGFGGRLQGSGVRYVVKRSLRRAGIDPANYGAHSLRSGMLTAAAKANASPLWMAKRSGHKHLEAMDPYIRAGRAFEMDPLKGVL